MVKPRLGRRIKEAIMGHESSNKKQDLELRAGEFNRMKLCIRQLIEALKAQHESLLRMNETRLQVALKVSALAEGSAISKEAGSLPLQDSELDKSDLSSYMAIHRSINDRQKTCANRYLKHVVGYAIEWEDLIVAHVTASLKRAKGLRRDVDHYQSKVESLTVVTNRIISRGQVVDTKVTSRSQRNEEKYKQARKEFDVFADYLVTLLEQVTVRGWQNLHPILLKLVQFDISVVSDESKMLSNLTLVDESLKRIANECGLQPRSGLKIVEEVTTQQSQLLNASRTESQGPSSNIQISYDQKDSNGKHGTIANLPIATLVKVA